MPDLAGKVAVVTGASRGVGRGVTLALADAGMIVYATGRTVSPETFADAWRIICVPCDHADDRQVEALFRRVLEEGERLDVLVNSAWGGYERMVEGGRFTWPLPFWE